MTYGAETMYVTTHVEPHIMMTGILQLRSCMFNLPVKKYRVILCRSVDSDWLRYAADSRNF